MAKVRVVTLLAFFGFVAASVKFCDLRDIFKSEYTSVYLKEGVTGEDLESTAKGIYREFLKTASLTQKDRIESYFAEWKRVVDLDGPFENDKKQSDALKAVLNPSDFQASLFVEQLLQNRDDSNEAIAVFKKAMISPDSMKLQVYFTGDGDIINGIVVASLKKSSDLYVITSIFD